MDRKSWLWRRKSSEKSQPETESSGSISSHSERLSDEQASLHQNVRSPEVTSKAAPDDEEINGAVKILNERLSAALSSISAKEELVKQHAKVAEEAVTGWEKAEKEVSILRQQLEATADNNSALEDRVGHLDEALKECVKQLRQSREQLDQKVQDAVVRSSLEWESKKSELERQLADLRTQLETAKVEAAGHLASDLQPQLNAAEKENACLRHKIILLMEQLELRTLERDLSTQSAEAASKQHLESTKRVVKLEAELRRLKNVTRKPYPINDYTSFTASSAFVDPVMGSQSDYGERLVTVEGDVCKVGAIEQNECDSWQSDSWASALITELGQFKNNRAPGKHAIVHSPDISLMDDFLEVERLAASEETEHQTDFLGSGKTPDKAAELENMLRAELEAMISKTTDLEEKLEMSEAEKMELEMALTLCQGQVEATSAQLKDREIKLVELQIQLSKSLDQINTSAGQLKDAETKLIKLQRQLTSVNNLKLAAEAELHAVNRRRHEAESQLEAMKDEMRTLHAKLRQMENENEKERALSKEAIAKCRKLEDQLLKMNHEADLRLEAHLKRAVNFSGDMKVKKEKELAVAAGKLAECQRTIASLGRQLKSLSTLEDFLELEKPVEVA